MPDESSTRRRSGGSLWFPRYVGDRLLRCAFSLLMTINRAKSMQIASPSGAAPAKAASVRTTRSTGASKRGSKATFSVADASPPSAVRASRPALHARMERASSSKVALAPEAAAAAAAAAEPGKRSHDGPTHARRWSSVALHRATDLIAQLLVLRVVEVEVVPHHEAVGLAALLARTAEHGGYPIARRTLVDHAMKGRRAAIAAGCMSRHRTEDTSDALSCSGRGGWSDRCAVARSPVRWSGRVSAWPGGDRRVLNGVPRMRPRSVVSALLVVTLSVLGAGVGCIPYPPPVGQFKCGKSWLGASRYEICPQGFTCKCIQGSVEQRLNSDPTWSPSNTP